LTIRFDTEVGLIYKKYPARTKTKALAQTFLKVKNERRCVLLLSSGCHKRKSSDSLNKVKYLVLQKLQCGDAMLGALHVIPMPLQMPTHEFPNRSRIIYY
jgi:hypothetical protein